MSWQDELLRLEEERVAGRLSEDDYQRRRAELAAQSGAEQGGTAEQVSPAGQDSPVDQDSRANQDSPANQQAGAQHSPFPPAFRWDTTAPGETNETTEIIAPVGNKDVGNKDADSAERTQIISTPGQPQPGPPEDDSERTQVVQAGPPAPPPYSQPTYQQGLPTADQPAWAQQESAPPWVSTDLPPIQEPKSGWMMQGPEFFEPESRASGTMRIVAIAAAVVVLVGIAFGSWFLWGRQTSPDVPGSQQTGQQQPAGPAPQEPEDPLAPADIGGVKEEKGVKSFRDLPAVRFLTSEELSTLSAAGAAESRLLITNIPQGKATILVSQVASRAGAITARDELVNLQLGYGFVTRTAPPSVSSVEVLDKPGTAPTLRALYVSGDRVVRVEMRGNDPTETATTFDQILDQQLEKLPADA